MADPKGYGPGGNNRGAHRSSADDLALDDVFARTFERERDVYAEREERGVPRDTGSANVFDGASLSSVHRTAAIDAAKAAAGRIAEGQGGAHDYFSVVPDRIAGTGTGRDTDDGKRGRGLLLAAFLIGIAVVGSAGVYMARSNTSGTDGKITAPTILAESNPYKVRPADPGGLQVPNQDKLVYDRLSPGSVRSSGVEKLLPEPVEPVEPPPAATGRMPSILESERPVSSLAAPEVSPPSAMMPNTAVKQSAPRPILPEKSVADTPVPVPPLQEPAVAPTVKKAQNTAIPESSPALAASTLTKKVTPARPGVTGGSYAVQLAALRDEASVRKTWETLKARYPDQLASLSMTIERANLGQKGVYYRLRATGLPSEAAARKLCTELAKQKVGCLFVGK